MFFVFSTEKKFLIQLDLIDLFEIKFNGSYLKIIFNERQITSLKRHFCLDSLLCIDNIC
jgi:hypothetical protein